MQCESCKSDNPATSKFCSCCGKLLLANEDIKSSSEITLSWFSGVMKSLGYEIQDESEEDKTFLAKHANKPKIFISLKDTIITFYSLWTMKKPGWGQKEKYLDAINKANKKNWFCACSLSNKMDGLEVTGMLFLTDKISSRDIASYVDLFISCTYSILEMPEIQSLC